jgi:hypothetical protein
MHMPILQVTRFTKCFKQWSHCIKSQGITLKGDQHYVDDTLLPSTSKQSPASIWSYHVAVCLTVSGKDVQLKIDVLHVIYSGVCYNKRCYNERCYNKRMIQWTVFINKIRMLQRTQMLQRTWRNTVGWHSTRVRVTCRAVPHWLERQSSSLSLFVRFSYQFRSVICLFVWFIKVTYINFALFLHLYFWFCIIFFLFKWLCWMVTLL